MSVHKLVCCCCCCCFLLFFFGGKGIVPVTFYTVYKVFDSTQVVLNKKKNQIVTKERERGGG